MPGIFCVLALIACLLAAPAHAQSSVDVNDTLTIRAFQSQFWSKFGPFEMRIAILPVENRWCADTARLDDFPWREKFLEAVVVNSYVALTHEIAKNERDGTCTYRTIYAYSILLAEEHLSDDERKELLGWQPSIRQASTGTSIRQASTETETHATKLEGSTASPLVNVPATSAFAAEAATTNWQTANSFPPISGSVLAPQPRLVTGNADGQTVVSVAPISSSGLAPQQQPVTGNEHAPKVDFCVRTLSPGSEGDDVKALQQILGRDPAIYPEGKVTNRYGPATTRAVKRFQKKYNIATDGNLGFGIVGPKTCQMIISLSGVTH